MEFTSDLAYEVVDSIGILTLNDPKGFNFFSWKLIEELGGLIDHIEADTSLRAVLIRSSGKNFSCGINFNDLVLANDSRYVMERLPRLQRVYLRWQELPIPVIAAVNGLCFGIGTQLILGSDIRIATEDAEFATQEARFGLSPDHGGTTRLTHLVGIGQAKRMILTCQQIKAEEALRIGLVEIVVKPEELHEYAFNLAKTICGFPPAGIRFAKQGINVANESSVMAGLFFEQAQATFCCGTEDFQEAIAAFREKRAPVFKNK